METQQVTTTDNHRFVLRWSLAVPPTDPRVFLLCPALGVRASYYDRVALTLSRAGATAVTMELRGQGTSSLRAGKGVDWGYEDHVRHDWPTAVAAIRERFPTAPLYLLGHSLGGQLSTLYLAKNPSAASGIILVASGTNDFRAWPFPGRYKTLVQMQLVAGLTRVLGYYPGAKVGFGDRQARQEMLDWASNGLYGRFRPAGAEIDYEAALAALKTSVWGFSLEGDALAPKNCTARLVAKLRSASVVHRHLTEKELPRECLHHFSWARNSAPLVACILQETAAA
jgi:predicted alpha/beta hydrolase